MSKTAHSRAREKAEERTTTGSPSVKEPTGEEIRMRAYYIYQERNGVDGNDLEDWLQAEHELREGRVETGTVGVTE